MELPIANRKTAGQALAEALLQEEILEADQIQALIDTGSQQSRESTGAGQ